MEATSEALDYIANLADGGCRDSITLLDKCISYDANITIKSAVEALGTVDYDTMFDLTECIAEGKQAKLIAIVEGVHRTGIDLKQFMKQYSLFLLGVAKYYLLGTFKYVQIPSLYKERLKTVTEITDYEFLLGLLHDVIGLNNAIKWETAPKPLIESTLLLISR